MRLRGCRAQQTHCSAFGVWVCACGSHSATIRGDNEPEKKKRASRSAHEVLELLNDRAQWTWSQHMFHGCRCAHAGIMIPHVCSKPLVMDWCVAYCECWSGPKEHSRRAITSTHELVHIVARSASTIYSPARASIQDFVPSAQRSRCLLQAMEAS